VKWDYFNPSPNIEDRREELDPIKQFLLDAGASPDPVDESHFTEAPTYNVQDYLRDNPTNTPLAQSDLARDAGAVDLAVLKVQRDAARRAEVEARLQRYRDLLSGKKIQDQPQGDLREINEPMRKIPR
jgi:hypothetical protein